MKKRDFHLVEDKSQMAIKKFSKLRTSVVSLGILGLTSALYRAYVAEQRSYTLPRESFSSAHYIGFLKQTGVGLRTNFLGWLNTFFSGVGAASSIAQNVQNSNAADYQNKQFGDINSRLESIESDLRNTKDIVQKINRQHEEELFDQNSSDSTSQDDEDIESIFQSLDADAEDLRARREYLVEQGKVFDKNRETLLKYRKNNKTNRRNQKF